MTTKQQMQLKLAGSSWGRVVLHIWCATTDGKWQWHLAGVVREINQQH